LWENFFHLASVGGSVKSSAGKARLCQPTPPKTLAAHTPSPQEDALHCGQLFTKGFLPAGISWLSLVKTNHDSGRVKKKLPGRKLFSSATIIALARWYHSTRQRRQGQPFCILNYLRPSTGASWTARKSTCRPLENNATTKTRAAAAAAATKTTTTTKARVS